MIFHRCVAVLFAGLVIAGCQQKTPEPTGPVYPTAVAPTPQTLDRVRRLAPNAIVGRVVAVLPEERLALAADLPVQDFKLGDVLTFMGGDDVNVGNGIVIRIGQDSLHVRYEQPQPGARPPAVGDLVIRFTR